MKYRVTHTTRYSGSEPVSVGHNQAWLKPRELPIQQVHHYRLAISPRPSSRSERTDYFGNTVIAFSFNRGYGELVVMAKSEVTLQPRTPADPHSSPPWERIRDDLRQPDGAAGLDAMQFCFDSPNVPQSAELAGYAQGSFSAGRPILDAVAELTSRIHRDFEYRPQSTTLSTPLRDVFRDRRGVCQDFAHLELAMLRSLGLAARYVSGYLRTYPPAGKPRLVGADASHAWISVYCGELNWIDVDPTNNLFPGDEHIMLAWGRDYGDIPPLRGVFIGGGTHDLSVSVDVEPLE